MTSEDFSKKVDLSGDKTAAAATSLSKRAKSTVSVTETDESTGKEVTR
jgi:hypothetical protein